MLKIKKAGSVLNHVIHMFNKQNKTVVPDGQTYKYIGFE